MTPAKNKTTEAVECFTDGHLCSQSVLGAFCEELGLDKDTALKLSQGFGGGFARCGETCGAVTGALMVLGLQYGSSKQGDSPEKAETYRKVNAFLDAFKAEHGSIVCKELLGCDISTPAGHERARTEQRFRSICPGLVEDAVDIIEMLSRPPAGKNS